MADEYEQYKVNPEDEYEQYKINRSHPNDESQSFISQLPMFPRTALSMLTSQNLQKPMREAIPQKFAAAGRGLTDIGEGAKQLYLETFHPEKADAYTQQVENERNLYKRTPVGRDPYLNFIRESTADIPKMAAMGPMGMEGGLLKRMLLGGASLGAAKGAEFVPQNDSRMLNTLIGGVTGAAIPGALPLARKGMEFVENIPQRVLGKKNPLLEIQQKLLEHKIGTKGQELEAATEDVNAQNKAYKEAVAESERQTNMSNPNKMQAKLNEQNAIANSLEKPEVGNYPVLSSEESGRNLQNSQQLHARNNENVTDIENTISQHLNAGNVHDVDLAAQIKNTQEGIEGPNGKRVGGVRRNISGMYDNITNNLKNQTVTINNDEAIKENLRKLSELTKSGEYHTPQAQTLLQDINKLVNEKQGSIPADEYLTMLRSAKDYARVARQKAFQPDLNAEERASWHKRFNELDEQIESMENHFENNIDPEDAESLRKANQAWRTQVKPLQRNPTYQTILHKGRIEGDVMKKLRGTDPGDVLMRNMIKNNPEMLKNIVGKEFADKPTALHDIGRLEQEYTSQMPELNNLLRNHRQAQNEVTQSNEILNRAEETHNQTLQQEANAHKYIEKQQKKIEDYQNKINKLNEKIPLLEKNIKKLTEEGKKKDINLQKKLSIEKQLKTLKNELNESRKKREESTTGLRKLFYIGKSLYKMGKKLI